MRFVSIALLFVSGWSVSLAQPPAGLAYVDVTAGVQFPPESPASLVGGHVGALRIFGNPGEQTVLAYSIYPPQTVAVFQGVTIGIDLTTMIVIWDGTSNPSAPVIGSSGFVDLSFLLPPMTGYGNLYVQAATAGPTGSRLANAVILAMSPATLLHIDRGADTLHPLGVNGALLSFTTTAAWQAFWALHAPATATMPIVDFSTSFVLARLAGTNLCHGVAITGASLDAAGVLQVATTITYGCGAPPPFPIPANRPFDIIALPASLATAPINETVSFYQAP